jgi:hypothetical protein
MVAATPAERFFPPLAAVELRSGGFRGKVEQSHAATGASCLRCRRAWWLATDLGGTHESSSA